MKLTTIHIRNKDIKLVLSQQTGIRGTGARDTQVAPGRALGEALSPLPKASQQDNF